MSNIKCSVESCVFNGAGKVCVADAIEVNNNEESCQGKSTDMEVGEIGASQAMASTSSETMCRTFKPKD